MNGEKRLWHHRGTTYLRMPLVVFLGGVLAIVLLVIIIWSIKRRPDATLRASSLQEITALLPSLAGLTHGTIEGGNSVQILQNGGFFPPLFRDIAAARESIHIEAYIWSKGRITAQLAQLLAAKAKQGVEVRILVDASGGRDLKGDTQEMLEKAGAKVAHFHPPRISNLGRMNNRDHRKLVIIDGRIGYTCGHGMSDNWTGNTEDKEHWRDTGVRISGPVVNQMQACFTENWIEETGEIPAGDKLFPRIAPAGNTPAHVVYASPAGNIAAVQVLYYLAIKAARREILIQNPYFLPDSDEIEALADAVRRGVDVRVMLPSDNASDNALVQHASHHKFGALLESGVKIWEYDRTLLHQKILVIDGIWSTVGSTNFDPRGFQINDEVNVGFLDATIAAELRAAFQNDMRFSRQRHFDEWQHRSPWHKFLDGLAYLGREQL